MSRYIETMALRGPKTVARILRNSVYALQEESTRKLAALKAEERKPHDTALERMQHEVVALAAEAAIARQGQQSEQIVLIMVKHGAFREAPDWLMEEARKTPKLRKLLLSALEYRASHMR